MLGKVSGAVPIRVRKDEGKFLATITRRHVSGAAAACAQDLGHLQAFVAATWP
jgi:hypothetical protein